MIKRSLAILWCLSIMFGFFCAQYASNAAVIDKVYFEGEKVIIEVSTPLDTKKVTAITPTGERVELRYNEEKEKWIGHWTIPEEFLQKHFNFYALLEGSRGDVSETKADEIVILSKRPVDVPIEIEGASIGDYKISTFNLLDKFKTFVKVLEVQGKVGEKIRSIRINNNTININNGTFKDKIILKYGKNIIETEYLTDDGRIIRQQYRMLRLLAQKNEFLHTREELFEMAEKTRMGLTLFGMIYDRYLELNGEVSRGEAAKIIAEIYDYPVRKDITFEVFSDVLTNNPYAPYILACKQNKVMDGNANGLFKPNDLLSFGEFSAIVCEVEGLSYKAPKRKFWFFMPKRRIKVNHWAVNCVLALEQNKYIKLPYKVGLSFFNRDILIKEMIEILGKSDKMKRKIQWLLDWESDYIIEGDVNNEYVR